MSLSIFVYPLSLAYVSASHISACIDEDMLRAGTLRKYGEIHADTGNVFVNQWCTEYISQILPFTITRCVSGPDFPYSAQRYRRPEHDENLSENGALCS